MSDKLTNEQAHLKRKWDYELDYLNDTLMIQLFRIQDQITQQRKRIHDAYVAYQQSLKKH